MRSPAQFSGTTGPISISSPGSAPIPVNGSGEPPKYVAVSTDSPAAIPVAFGISTVDAATDAFFFIAAGSDPVIVNVAGATHFAWGASSGSSIIVAALEF